MQKAVDSQDETKAAEMEADFLDTEATAKPSQPLDPIRASKDQSIKNPASRESVNLSGEQPVLAEPEVKIFLPTTLLSGDSMILPSGVSEKQCSIK